MPTPDELREQIALARDDFRMALTEAASAWERVPDGDDAWSPRQTAEHAIRSEPLFTSLVCTACGYHGVEFDDKPAYATADQAVAGFDAAIELCNKKLKYVTETDLEKSHRDMTSAQLMELNASHLREHAAQIRDAANA